MRLDLFLSSLHTLSSLWGGSLASSVCRANSLVVPPEVSWSPGARDTAEVTAFVGVAVIPMDTERVLTNQTVVVENGRIRALGPVGKIKVPVGAVQVDGRGRYLLPGLGDMHSHFLSHTMQAQDEYTLLKSVANGVTAIRNLNSIRDAQLRTFRQIGVAAPKPSPLIYLAGETWPLAKLGLSSDSAAAVYKAAGYDFLIGSGTDTLFASAYRIGIPLGVHIGHSRPWAEALGLGTYGGSIEHLYWLLDTLGVKDGEVRFSMPQLQSLAAEAQRAGLWVTPTLNCMTGGLEGAMAPTPHSKALQQVVKTLHQAGVKLLLSGDDAGDVHDELAGLVLAGLTPYEALVTGTRNVAQYFGRLDDRGTIAVGKRADLVLLYGNPLQNIQHTREPAGVMVGGRWFDRAMLDGALLASPKVWIQSAVNPEGFGMGASGLVRGSVPPAQNRQILAHVQTFEVLADSLALAPPTTAERLVQRQAAELAGIRANVAPAVYQIFDPVARIWLREQARKGYQVTVAGVAPAP